MVWIFFGLAVLIIGVMIAISGFRQSAIHHRTAQRLKAADRYADAAGAGIYTGSWGFIGALGIVVCAGGLIMIVNGLLEL